jgi:hypothetical protein
MAFQENTDPIKDMEIGIIKIDELPIEKYYEICKMISAGDTSRLMYKNKLFDNYDKKTQENIFFKLQFELGYCYPSGFNYVSTPTRTARVIPDYYSNTRNKYK